ncbi:hypothetical protein GQ464_013795 [Rhodocaloribacter litoris]|uniref:hypothetical protein n=1 Tax=Rhodocaloribacter litoris TaxID=2558931 RepID=UPI00141F49A0|nr:hypothetical protein [Rhodocaloribacter litoris]QXD14495.1 hypothetical protein GQ464_013795 [Rhodocaloribacter litoris]
MITDQAADLLKRAEQGIMEYLNEARAAGRIDEVLYNTAVANTVPNLKAWLADPNIDRISKNLKEGIYRTIEAEKWEDLVNAYRQNLRFGTGGIRGMMAFDRESIRMMYEHGIDVPILKGPNTINEIVFLKTSVGVAQFGKDQDPAFERIVIGYDSRVRGQDFARMIAELFLAYGYTVYFFDEPCPYPEVTFAIPHLKADVGILISASHNDYRYNGYKLSSANGSQFDPKERNEMYNDYIATATTDGIKLLPFDQAPADKLYFLGGAEPVEGFDYGGREANLINIHARHQAHVKTFLMTPDLAERQAASDDPLQIAYCAFHGAGRKAVPRLLADVGLTHVRAIHHNGLNDLNGLFPSFKSDPGEEQQPDPGDPRAAEIAVGAFKAEYGEEAWEEIDILIGTDPDADRCGVVVKVPENQRHVYGGKDYYLMPADDLWTLLIWYRLYREIEKHGAVQEPEKRFLTLSHTTSEAIAALARKHGIGVVKTWVGFAALSAATRDVWEGKHDLIAGLVEGRNDEFVDLCHPFVCTTEGLDARRSFNIGAMEQSNGFSLLGGPPKDKRSLGTGGHVRDKDGTFAAFLMAEVAAWAKENGTNLIELLDKHVYLDPDVGLYMTFYEPDPLDGEYPGIEGDRIKLAILRRALGLFQFALAGDLEIAGMPVKSATIYRTGKYDAIYPATWHFQFPDEGIRFYFDDEQRNHLTIRPSGTGNSLRFHIQLHTFPTADTLIEDKLALKQKGEALMDALREMLRAPRG